jgi:cyanophycin synthetase
MKDFIEAGSPAIIFPIITEPMKVVRKNVYRGPHLYSHTPMISLELDLARLENWPTNKIPDFKEKLLALLPSLQRHGCSYGVAGGFIKRVEEGTWLGHVMEHVALELQTLAGLTVTRGKTRSVKGKTGIYKIMYEYEYERAGLWAGRYALELINSLLPENLSGIENTDIIVGDKAPFPGLEAAIREIKNLASREQFGPTTRSIVEAAKKRGIPIIRLDDESLVQLGWGKHQRRICGSMTNSTSQIAVDTAGDKELTKTMLRAAHVPVPEGEVVRTLEGMLEVAHDLGYPVTIKPLDGNHGRGVTTNILNDEQAKQAFTMAKVHSPSVIVEQFYAGRDYRILVINGKVVAVSERVPAHVVGDGIHTIEQLVEKINSDPMRGDGHNNMLSKIVIDEQVNELLTRDGHALASIPAIGQKIFLRCTANMSTGGTAIDRTDEIHPSNTVLMERAARIIGLDIAGIDVVTKDIALPIDIHGGGIVEVNASPGFRMHLHPSEGRSRPVGEAVVSMLFPKEAVSRIPVISVTGTNGKSTTTRMIAHILRQKGHRVGFTSTSGVYVNEDLIWEGDASGPYSASLLMRDPSIDIAVLETARGGILREGLGVDYCDAGAVLNISADHLGLEGVDTIEDLAAVKSVVVESVNNNGTSVLNADDPLTLDMARYAGGRLCFFSMQGGHKMNAQLRAHIEKGGWAVVCEDWAAQEEIVIHADGQRFPLMDIKQIPATHGGIARFNVQNALAAAAIAFGMDTEIECIRAALASFGSSYEENPGRFNIYDGHGFRVVMDYAHNPGALKAFLETIGNMRGNYRHIIGMVSTPGDRRDEDIREMGRLGAEGFDFIVFREGTDRRNRPPGELVGLLTEGACSNGFSKQNIVCVETEAEAVDLCLRKASPGDLVILSPADVKTTWKQMLDFRPQLSMPFMQDVKIPSHA